MVKAFVRWILVKSGRSAWNSKRISTFGQVKADNTACQASQSPNLAFAELMRGERKHWRGGGRGAPKQPPRPFLLIPIPKPEGINSTNLSKVSRRRLDGDRKSNSALDRRRFLRDLGESYSDVILRRAAES